MTLSISTKSISDELQFFGFVLVPIGGVDKDSSPGQSW